MHCSSYGLVRLPLSRLKERAPSDPTDPDVSKLDVSQVRMSFHDATWVVVTYPASASFPRGSSSLFLFAFAMNTPYNWDAILEFCYSRGVGAIGVHAIWRGARLRPSENHIVRIIL